MGSGKTPNPALAPLYLRTTATDVVMFVGKSGIVLKRRSVLQLLPAIRLGLRWSHLFGQAFRVDKWIVCRG